MQAAEGDVTNSSTTAVEKDLGHRLPWTGRALGMADVMLASARSSPVLVGLIGPYNAGKTSFLTSMYAYFSQSGIVGEYGFAGSYTLNAWERLKSYGRWPNSSGPTFPPHTSDSGERVPSLLHLALRKGSDAIVDVLFTDVPGEWFARWVKDQTADNAAGARWIAANASHFLFFVDRGVFATSTPEVGTLRHNTILLARLLSEHIETRPVTAVWTKSDGELSMEMEAPVRRGVVRHLGDHPGFNVSVNDGSCLKVLEHVLSTKSGVGHLANHNLRDVKSTFWNYKGGSI